VNNKTPHTFPLHRLMQVLSEKGFHITPDMYVRVQTILQQLGKQYHNQPEKLAHILAPVLAKNPQQQQLFYEVFEEYLDGFVPPPPPILPISPSPPSEQWYRNALIWLGLFGVLGLGILFVTQFFQNVEQPINEDEKVIKEIFEEAYYYEIGDTVYFEDIIDKHNIDSTNFIWGFGDNTFDSLNLKPFHIYNEKGIYNSALACIIDGDKRLIRRSIYVSCVGGDGIGFSLSHTDVELGDTALVIAETFPKGLKNIEWDIAGSPEVIDNGTELLLIYNERSTGRVSAVVKGVNCTTGDTISGEASATVVLFDTLKISDLKVDIGENKLIYTENFEREIGKEWSRDTTTKEKKKENTFLGYFKKDSVILNITDLSEYEKIKICFDFLIYRDAKLLRSQMDSLQRSGDISTESLFSKLRYFNNWKPKCKTLNTSEKNTTDFTFSALGLSIEQDATWGIDNVKIYGDSLSYKPTLADLQRMLPQRFTTKPNFKYYLYPFLLFLTLLGGFAWLYNRLNKAKTPPFDPNKNSQAPYKIPFPEQSVIPATPQVYQLAKMLRQRQAGWRYRVDIPATVRVTIAKGGFPIIRQRGNTRSPEYLFLIDLETPDAQQVRWLESVLEMLRREEVLMACYYFKQDPSWCWNREQPDGLDIDELHQRFPDHRLVIYGDGDYWLDSFEARTDERVLREFPLWSQRALLTTVPPENWSYRERLLQQYFNLIPGDMKEPLVLATALMTQPEDFEQIRQDRSRSTDRFIEFNSLDDIRDFLQDPHLVDWLAATTVYPEPQWEITLAVGKAFEQFPEYQGILTLPNLRRLTQIKWMNRDAFPENLRQDLLAHLHTRPQVEARARETVSDLLETIMDDELDNNSYAYLDAHIKFIQQKRKIEPVSREIQDEAIRLANQGFIPRDKDLDKVRQNRNLANIAGALVTAFVLSLILCTAIYQSYPQITENWGLVKTVSFDLPIRIGDPRFTNKRDSLGVKIVSDNFQRAFNVMANEDYLVRGIPVEFLDSQATLVIRGEKFTFQEINESIFRAGGGKSNGGGVSGSFDSPNSNKDSLNDIFKIDKECVCVSEKCGGIEATYNLKMGKTYFCAGDEVKLTNLSSSDIDYGIVYWGDNTVDTLMNTLSISHVYENNPNKNTYNICLKVIKKCDDGISCHSKSSPIIVVSRPSAEFDFVTDACVGEVITFVNNSQSASSFSWNFGDGGRVGSVSSHPLFHWQFLKGADSKHTYNSEGAKDVTLIARNMCGADTLTRTINICEDKKLLEEEYIFVSTPFSLNPTPIQHLKSEFKDKSTIKPNIFLSDVVVSNNTVNSGQTVTVNSRQHISSHVGISIRSQLEYAWNTDTTWSGATILGTDYSSFKNGDSYDNESFSFTVPDNVSGTIYLLLTADAINNVIESDETDNREYIPLIIEGINNN